MPGASKRPATNTCGQQAAPWAAESRAVGNHAWANYPCAEKRAPGTHREVERGPRVQEGAGRLPGQPPLLQLRNQVDHLRGK